MQLKIGGTALQTSLNVHEFNFCTDLRLQEFSTRFELDSSADNTMCIGVNYVCFSSPGDETPVDETDKPLLNHVTRKLPHLDQYYGNHGFIVNHYFLELALHFFF